MDNSSERWTDLPTTNRYLHEQNFPYQTRTTPTHQWRRHRRSTGRPGFGSKGVTVDLFEQATEFKEVGAGLQVGPNAFRIFEQLGVTEKISALATFPESVTLMDATRSEPIVCMPLGADFLERFKYPYGLMHRADLHKVLLTACQGHKGITLHTNSKITAFSDSKDRVNATLSSGAEVSGQGLVGADGL